MYYVLHIMGSKFGPPFDRPFLVFRCKIVHEMELEASFIRTYVAMKTSNKYLMRGGAKNVTTAYELLAENDESVDDRLKCVWEY